MGSQMTLSDWVSWKCVCNVWLVQCPQAPGRFLQVNGLSLQHLSFYQLTVGSMVRVRWCAAPFFTRGAYPLPCSISHTMDRKHRRCCFTLPLPLGLLQSPEIPCLQVMSRETWTSDSEDLFSAAEIQETNGNFEQLHNVVTYVIA